MRPPPLRVAIVAAAVAGAALAQPPAAERERALRQALAADPGAAAGRELGLLLGSQGRLAEAYALLRPWALAHPGDVEAAAAAAFCALELERPAEAEELIARLPQDPAPFRVLRARSRLLANDPQAAIDLLAPALAASDGALALDIRRLLAEAHLLRGSAADAVRLLDGRATTPDLALLLGRAHYQDGDPARALAALAPFAPRALAGEASDQVAADLLLLHGRLLLLGGRAGEATPSLERAATLSPADREAWMLLAQARAAAGDGGGAAAALARLRQLQEASRPNSVLDRQIDRDRADPTGREARLAWQLLEAGRLDEALAVAAAEAALAPGDGRVQAAAAAALLRLGRIEEAAAAAQRAVPTPPPTSDEAARLAALARELEAAGRSDAAAAVRRRQQAGAGASG